MSRKVSLARALVHDPDILLLDEPFEAIDILTRKILREQLREMKEAGKTILCTAHRPGDIEKLCDHLLIFDAGTLIVDAPFSKLKNDYGEQSVDGVFVAAMKDRINEIETRQGNSG